MAPHPNEPDSKTRELLERSRRELKEQQRHAHLLKPLSEIALSEPSRDGIIGESNLSDSQLDALAKDWNAQAGNDQSSAVALSAGDGTDELAAEWRSQRGEL